jgi:copper homeostasis protein
VSRVTLEVAIETVEDAVAAFAGGADRLELSAALDLGGLTPSLGAVQTVAAAVPLPVLVMVRPRAGDFVYEDADFRVMLRDVELFAPHAPAGFVFGLLTPDADVDADRCRELVRAAAGRPCVFHRAFDRCRDPLEAAKALADLGFVRVLTSGREATALAGAPRIGEWRRAVGDRIGLLPCGRVRAENAAAVLAAAGGRELHGSFAEPVQPGPGKGRKGYPPRSRTGRSAVAACRAAIDGGPPV